MSKTPPRTPRAAARRRAPIDNALDPDLHRALSDPTRCRLLACLAKCGRGCAVGELGECCEVDLSVVSRHLKILERAGVVASRREGRIVRCRLLSDELASSMRALADALEACPQVEDCSEGGCAGGR